MVTTTVHEAIAQLAADPKQGNITNPDQAFIAIIAFGAKPAFVPDKAGRPFILSVTEIEEQFGNGLGDYLFDCLHSDKPGVDRHYTDITAAVKLAREVYDAAIKGDMSGFGTGKMRRIMEHTDIVKDGVQISVPNVRVMLYSDGEHNPPPSNRGPVINAFDSLDPSVLMTAFIGDEKASEETRRGADQLLGLANTCPEDHRKGYFLINEPGRIVVLRKLFRMTSGASGFCDQCLIRVTGGIRAQEAHHA